MIRIKLIISILTLSGILTLRVYSGVLGRNVSFLTPRNYINVININNTIKIIYIYDIQIKVTNKIIKHKIIYNTVLQISEKDNFIELSSIEINNLETMERYILSIVSKLIYSEGKIKQIKKKNQKYDKK